jgi:hypothetical protein
MWSSLSYRDVEELLAQRGFDVSYETVRRWVLKFGPLIARKLRQGRPEECRFILQGFLQNQSSARHPPHPCSSGRQ